MLVHEVMSTGVVTARRTDSVRSVVTKMLSRHCGAIPVVEDNELLIGMVTLRDVLIPLYPNYGEYIHDNVHSRDFTEMEEGYADVLRSKSGGRDEFEPSDRFPLHAGSRGGILHGSEEFSPDSGGGQGEIGRNGECRRRESRALFYERTCADRRE